MEDPTGAGAAEALAADGWAMLEAGFARLLAAAESGDFDHGTGDDSPDSGEGGGGVVGFMHRFEGFRRRLSLVDHAVIRHGQDGGLPGQVGQPSMQRVLSSTLRISRAEAGRRVRAAEAVGVRVSMLGEVLSPVRPVLAAAQRAGVVGVEQVAVVVRALAGVDRPGFDPADVVAAEELLTGFAATFGPEDLRRLADTVVDRIDPDGSRPRDDLNQDRRHVELRPKDDGSWVGELRLTGPVGAKLSALLSPLAKPRVGTIIGPDGRPVEAVDIRTYGQRMHDALEDLCDRLLRSGELPDSGGTPATVIVTINWEDLAAKTGYGTTSDGVLISTREVLAMASEAEIIPVVLNASGAVLDLGRSRRIASKFQTLALIARDGGCSFPACDHPPEWCQRHHIKGWVDGGLTDLNNLTLLCGYHHRNFAGKGWALPDQRRRAARMDTAQTRRPDPNPTDQPSHPRPTRPGRLHHSQLTGADPSGGPAVDAAAVVPIS